MSSNKSRVTASSITKKKGIPLVAITAYDYTSARLVDSLVDIVLVGDSLGQVIQGQPDTLSVTLDQMVYHTSCVDRGLSHAHLVADLPFLTYQPDIPTAIRSAGRLLAEGRAQSVKLEGGTAMAATIVKLVELGIPVMGHIGLTPQSVNTIGGYKIQGKTARSQNSILEDALAVEDAGAYAVVLEGMPCELAKLITERVKIPTIGIGAGAECDGQILVIHDLLGLNPEFKPRFVKRYAELFSNATEAVATYAREVRERQFPGSEHSFYAHTELARDSAGHMPSLEN